MLGKAGQGFYKQRMEFFCDWETLQPSEATSVIVYVFPISDKWSRGTNEVWEVIHISPIL